MAWRAYSAVHENTSLRVAPQKHPLHILLFYFYVLDFGLIDLHTNSTSKFCVSSRIPEAPFPTMAMDSLDVNTVNSFAESFG